jgi:hypothetical protein
LAEVRKEAQQDKTILRMSGDAKAAINIGDFSRRGKNRFVVKAADHDFKPDEKVTPYGILLPDHNRVYIYLTTSRVTSDFIADCFEDCWQQIKAEFPEVQTVMIHQDNGPENHSRRTQFMARMVQWSDKSQVHICLAYYPPYHSKYNPIERVWGVLEQHWNGSLLNHLDVVTGFAKTMKWKGTTPLVKTVTQVYETGKKLTQKAMDLLEQRFEREDGIAKWFVTIHPLSLKNG